MKRRMKKNANTSKRAKRIRIDPAQRTSTHLAEEEREWEETNHKSEEDSDYDDELETRYLYGYKYDEKDDIDSSDNTDDKNDSADTDNTDSHSVSTSDA
jgi:hypothetical protein